MIEVAMVFDKEGHAIFWLSPKGSSSGAIPDSSNLWDRIWRNREHVGGVVHTHPWDGKTLPSHTDVTTFAAIEKGLGKQLLWPIVTMTHVNYFVRNVFSDEYVMAGDVLFKEQSWWLENILELRRLSLVGDRT